MRYYLLNGEGCMWLRYHSKNKDGIEKDHSVDCPYTKGEGSCGSWCPLFEMFPVTDGTRRKLKHVHLHCGAGTRVIEIEEEAK